MGAFFFLNLPFPSVGLGFRVAGVRPPPRPRDGFKPPRIDDGAEPSDADGTAEAEGGELVEEGIRAGIGDGGGGGSPAPREAGTDERREGTRDERKDAEWRGDFGGGGCGAILSQHNGSYRYEGKVVLTTRLFCPGTTLPHRHVEGIARAIRGSDLSFRRHLWNC